MPKGVYIRTKDNYVLTENRLRQIRNSAEMRKGVKRPPRSETWVENAKKARMINPIRNWKGGISSIHCYRSWVKNKRNRVIKRINKEGSSHTFGEWEILKAQYNWTCPCCKKIEPEIKLTEDHIVPLSKGGSDNIENIQPLCKSCNCKKHTKIIKY